MQITISTPQKVRRVGNSLVVTIPADIAERHNVKVGDLVRLAFEPLDVVPRLRPELARLVEEEISANLEALRYLRDN